jgi:hypothetical protein
MSPIEFDQRMNEYHIVHHGVRIYIEYCFNCGGRLPESKRDSYFTTPNENEMAEIEELLRNVRSIPDVIRILGAADDVHKGAVDAVCETVASDPPRNGRVLKWKQQLDYRERWVSLTLIVHENVDGSVAYLIAGKQLAPK